MNPISLGMDGLLAVLLLTAVAVGVRLNGKLKTLRAGQGQFVDAVGSLDAAAARAEAGLQALRAATEEAHDALLSRIETARALLPKLDRATEQGAAAAARLEEGARIADLAARRAGSSAETAERAAGDLAAAAQRAAQSAGAARAAARRDEAEAATPEPVALFETSRASRRGAETPSASELIPFPSPRRDDGDTRGLAAALRAAERIVEAETAPEPAMERAGLAAVRARRGAPIPQPATMTADDRLSRFVARRRGARG